MVDPSLDVKITRKMWGGAIVTGLGTALALEGVIRVFDGSPLMPMMFVAVIVIITLLLRRWIYLQYELQYPDSS